MTEDKNKKEKELFKSYEETLINPCSKIKPESGETGHIIYTACLTGGNTAAKVAMKECEPIVKACADGDPKKAVYLSKFFSVVMASQWLHWLNKNNKEIAGAPLINFQTLAKSILELFDDFSPAEIDIADKLNTQFNYEIKNNKDMLPLGILLLAKALEACGEKVVDWSKVNPPVENPEDLIESGAIINTDSLKKGADILKIWDCQSAGVSAMGNYYKEMTKRNAETTETDRDTA